jgi:soluble lytic murein transglycosylase-like protein
MDPGKRQTLVARPSVLARLAYLLDPGAISPAGAAGLAQFMPGIWADVSRQLGYGNVSPHLARYAIEAGAYYMASLRRQWSSPRPDTDRQVLARAAYNTGMGHLLRRRSFAAALWAGRRPPLACRKSPAGMPSRPSFMSS